MLASWEAPVLACPPPPMEYEPPYIQVCPSGAPLNPLQFNQINKRRAYRSLTGQTTRPRTALIDNMASRKEHALRRPRGPGGRFLRTAEGETSSETSDEKQTAAKAQKKASKLSAPPTRAPPMHSLTPPPQPQQQQQQPQQQQASQQQVSQQQQQLLQVSSWPPTPPVPSMPPLPPLVLQMFV